MRLFWPQCRLGPRKISKGKLRARDRSQAGREVPRILPHDESRASESGAPRMG